ncbi:MAG: DUF4864 domain-containing protein [Acidobacteriota bacterium]
MNRQHPLGRTAAAVALCLVGCCAPASGLEVAAPKLSNVQAAETQLSPREWTAIRKVISQQLAALKRGDGERAFGYASPGIRAQFGDARNFMAMVRSGYAPLLEARYTEFLEGAVIDAVIVQPLRLVGRDNTVLVALYTMEKRNGAWRINGCQLAPSTVKAA